jgi:uncharacterized protein YuzE
VSTAYGSASGAFGFSTTLPPKKSSSFASFRAAERTIGDDMMRRVKITIGSATFDHADYDAENDVLYLHVGEPQEAEGEETPEGHVLRYAAGARRIVGLTVLGPQRILDKEGELRVTIPEPVKVSANDLAPALAAV